MEGEWETEKVQKKRTSGKIKIESPVHAMNVTGRSAALIPRIVKLSTSGGELSALCPGLFILGKNPS